MKITPRRDYMLSLESVVMTDIVLNMFIFFFISFSLLYTFSKNPGIKVTLPAASKASPQEENITVFISPDNEIFFNAKKVNIDQLAGILKERLDASKKKIVVIKSDEKVSLGLAVKIMDSAKQAGTEGIVISTAAKENAGK
ncbi:MAG: biopolymer transporter ExbD [Candidatus Omnitrophota bacterium]|nr:biopolymer transporter ExbD [Candidatus Omnitrophota bacterium]